MAPRQNLGDLRSAIEQISRQVMSERGSGEASNVVILDRLKKDRSQLVAFFSPQLIDIALTKLLNEVCSRKRGAASMGAELNLVGGYGRIPESVSIGRGLKKDTVKLSISEARDWLQNHSKRVIQKDYRDLERLIEDCAKYVESDDDTIEVALLRKNGMERHQVRELELEISMPN